MKMLLPKFCCHRMTRLIRFTRMYIAMDDAKRKRNKNAIEENRNKNFFLATQILPHRKIRKWGERKIWGGMSEREIESGHTYAYECR